MSEAAADAVTQQRLFFKRFNHLMVWWWNKGYAHWINAWPRPGGRVMMIHHRGRKTGLPRQTPVNYAIIDGVAYCTAGFGAVSDWYRNILANPQVEIELPNSRYPAVAEEVSEDPQRIPWLRQVLINSGIVAPLMGIRPKTMSDAALDAVTQEYRLVRFRKAAVSGELSANTTAADR